MNVRAPRLVIGGTGSGCGKTTVTCALLQAFVEQGLDTAAFKCGPDYIDPMFHSRVIGARSRNLDTFLCSRETVPALLAHSAGQDISVIEGVMGYYDGLAGTSSENSTADIANLTQSPSVLVVSAKGMSLTLAAVLKGLLSFGENTIQGVILNGVSASMTEYYAGIVERNTGLHVYGALPRDAACAVESRHLGLVTASEISGLQQKMHLLAQHAREGMDLSGLLALAQRAPDLPAALPEVPLCGAGLRIAVARDEAFCFDYADSLETLERMGARLVSFSPLYDTCLPQQIDGLLLCGGYPELYAKQLSERTPILAEIRAAIQRGLPTIAECGGFLLLHDVLEGEHMAGVCGGTAELGTRLRQFGYITMTAKRDSLLCRAGESLTAHEFHYVQSTQPGTDFYAQKPLRNRGWDCVHATQTLHAGYPHIHFAGNLLAAQRFLSACRMYCQTQAEHTYHDIFQEETT
ncbi:MAG: cobyrinate a,c-diamide synthase [Eubacteriales bacterium]|nr:cobyrinate a,c-diamide synthase [Eubacteriales bacterium]